MSAQLIQANYEQLEQIAAQFAQQAEGIAETRNQVWHAAEALVDSGWEGAAATRFIDEMQQEVLPALDRLSAALEMAHDVTLQIREVVRQAEEEAAALFQGEAKEQESEEEDGGGGLWGTIGGWVHTGLDVLGLVPVVGEVADGANALIYLAEGDHLNAGLSAAGMIPFLGWGATGTKLGIRAGRELLEEGGERAVREGVEEFTDDGIRILREDPIPDVTVATGHKSVRDPSFLHYDQLTPSTRYTRNGYEYTTDAQGRVIEASGELRVQEYPRYPAYETQVGNSAGLATDDGGHLIGNRFGGVSEGVNLVPQNSTLNRGAWRSMEDQWATALRRGDSVQVNVRPIYGSSGHRPLRFEVDYYINGELFSRSFDN